MANYGFNAKSDSLSHRQLQVMQGRSLGFTTEQLGALLEASPSTMQEHVDGDAK